MLVIRTDGHEGTGITAGQSVSTIWLGIVLEIESTGQRIAHGPLKGILPNGESLATVSHSSEIDVERGEGNSSRISFKLEGRTIRNEDILATCSVVNNALARARRIGLQSARANGGVGVIARNARRIRFRANPSVEAGRTRIVRVDAMYFLVEFNVEHRHIPMVTKNGSIGTLHKGFGNNPRTAAKG